MHAVKSREDYLLKYEERLLAALAGTYQSVNRTLALMYTITGIALLVEWGRVTEVAIFGARFPLNEIEMIAALPILLTVLTIFLDYSLITASRALRELKMNASELIAANPDAMPVSLGRMDLFGTGLIGFVLSFARAEVTRLLHIKTVLPQGLEIPLTFPDAIRVTLILLRWNHRLVNWTVAIVIRIAFIVAILGLPLAGSAAVLRERLGSGSGDPMPWTLLALPPILLLALAGISLIFCTLLLLASYSADYLESMKRDFIEVTRSEALTLYQSMISVLAQALIRAVVRI